MNLEPLVHGNGTEHLISMKFSDALDFVAKVYLALESHAIMYPDPSSEREDNRANAIYNDVQAFDHHTKLQRERFEARWVSDTKHEKRVSQRVKNNIANDKKLMNSAHKDREKKYVENSYQWSFMDNPLEQRLRKPTAVHMHISRYSISLRYAAILFTALSHLRQNVNYHRFFLGNLSLFMHLRFIVCLIDLDI